MPSSEKDTFVGWSKNEGHLLHVGFEFSLRSRLWCTLCILDATISFNQLFKFLVGQQITVFKMRKIKFWPSYMPKAM